MKLIFESFGQKEPLDDEFSIMFPLNFVPPISLKNRPFNKQILDKYEPMLIQRGADD